MIDKQDWHIEINGGFVPLLESTDGSMIYESAVIADFANDFAPASQGLSLWPHLAKPGDLNPSLESAKMKL